jgi:hypothetical protein
MVWAFRLGRGREKLASASAIEEGLIVPGEAYLGHLFLINVSHVAADRVAKGDPVAPDDGTRRR